MPQLSKLLAISVACASLTWAATPAPVMAQRVAQDSAGLCRRAPAPIVLPPERETPTDQRYIPPPPPPPPPAPPPPPSPTMAPDSSAAEAVVVTGSRDESRGSAFEPRGPVQTPPEPGILTAGDYDDLLNPGLYATYVANFLKNESLQGVPRVDTANVLTVNVRDAAGRAVPFANVTLTCSDGNTLTLPTTADGAAVFFPQLDRLGQRVDVSVRSGGRVTRGDSIDIAPRGTGVRQTISVPGAAPSVRRFDLALVIDTTGSMSDELEYLKSEIGDIVGDLRAEHPGLDIRVGLVVYRDTGDEYVTRTFPLTSNIERLRANLSTQRADGGGDYPEAVEQAMARAVALDWRRDAVRSILFVADAPPHADDVVSTWRSAEVARARRIQIVPVAASGVGSGAEYMMRAMAAVTQSRYLFLTDDSGVGNPHAPPTVDCYLVTRLNPLIRRVLDSQISGHRVEPRDGEVIRSVGRYDQGRCLAPDAQD